MFVDVKRQDLVKLCRVARGGLFVLDAQDDGVSLQVHTPEAILCVPVTARVKRPGCVALPDLYDLLLRVPDDFITIQTDAHHVRVTAKDCKDCSVAAPRQRGRIASLVASRRYVELDGEQFVRGLRFAKIACPRQQTADCLYDLRGVCLDFEVGALVGIDGQRMAVAYLHGAGTVNCHRMVIPLGACNLILHCPQFMHSRLKVWCGLNDLKTQAPVLCIKAGGVWMIVAGSTLFPSSWPCWVPCDAKARFKTLVRDVLQALNALPEAPAESPSVTVAGGEGCLRFSRAGAVQVMPIDKTAPFAVELNEKHLRVLLEELHTTIVWSIHDKGEPVLLADATDQFHYLLMPMR